MDANNANTDATASSSNNTTPTLPNIPLWAQQQHQQQQSQSPSSTLSHQSQRQPQPQPSASRPSNATGSTSAHDNSPVQTQSAENSVTPTIVNTFDPPSSMLFSGGHQPPRPPPARQQQQQSSPHRQQTTSSTTTPTSSSGPGVGSIPSASIDSRQASTTSGMSSMLAYGDGAVVAKVANSPVSSSPSTPIIKRRNQIITPEMAYSSAKKPFSYADGYHYLINYVRQR